MKLPQRKMTVDQGAVQLRAAASVIGAPVFRAGIGAADVKADVHRIGLAPKRTTQIAAA